MDDVIERGDAALAESRLIAIHRLKTAVPAASLARMGALVGGGTEAQIEAIGRYYESIGVAFQVRQLARDRIALCAPRVQVARQWQCTAYSLNLSTPRPTDYG